MKISEEISNISARISGIWSPLALSIQNYARTLPSAFTGVWGAASNLMWWRKKAITAQESMEEATNENNKTTVEGEQQTQISVMIEEENEVGGKALSTPSAT